MDSTLYPLDYPVLAREALDGGFTTALDGFRPTRGFVVSTRKDAERVWMLRGATDYRKAQGVADALYHYVIDHGHDLRHGYLLGAWRDGDRVVIDLVQVFEVCAEAMRAAREADQDAIYDLGTSTVIELPPPFEVIGHARYDSDADELVQLDAIADAELARWDDDPNPYHGDYSEE